ncbi:MAG: Fic family protein [Desulfuromonadaceae bacterium]
MTNYIHELPEWPSFRWNQDALLQRLVAVRHQQGRLIGRMESIGFSSRAEAVLNTLTQDVLKSSEIEGEILDKDQVRSSIARHLGIEIGALAPTDRHIDGVVEMILDATQNHIQPLTKARLFGWHKLLFPASERRLGKINVGAWRDDVSGPMQVISGPYGRERVHFEAPSAARIDKEMATFLDWFNDDDCSDLVLKAGIAHLWFVTIHPFEDGNGRIARAITDMLLARSEQSSQRFYSMSLQIRQERNVYYDSLEAAQKGTLEITTWLEWFLDCLGRAIGEAEGALAIVMGKARFWESHAGVSFNDRQRLLINKLIDGFEGKLTTSKWAKLAKCSQDTALRDILSLVESGVLEKDSAGGRSTSYSLREG